ncbi:VOC family protein [Nocardioides bruguierae]|uniref:VOC family protein n=1 Tax=Nocardioides bruguierae TaxID=2945102 RepID=A0A9X2IEG1_9ACTN|nr:VOC family protein [Nocardioides bruguierae]MCL8027190.1 VOC family protein [Nocardioides bruguierae]MCM0620018.1 VOC family protein [Nocardioides bruguierae]
MPAFAAYPSVVLDCPDPGGLARFYGSMLGWTVRVDDDGSWAEARPEDGSACLCFQQVEAYAAPSWPGQEHPQQMHLDVMVRDLDDAEPQALALGATRAEHQPGTSFRVFLDPAGHPFCLCVD